MLKRWREAESDSAMPSAEKYTTVFVDTSLGTRLAMQLSDSDTVLEFKRKLTQEHARCFPNNGEIRIHSLKVKLKRNFYHLPDFMLVCSALDGIEGNWFISADASGSSECYINQKASECDTRDQCGVISSGTNKILALTMSLPDGVPEDNIVSVMTLGQKVEKYSDRTSGFWKNDSLENSLETRSPAKKKHKSKYHEVVLHSPILEDRCTQFHASDEETLQPILAGCRIGVGEETPNIIPDCIEETAEDVVVRYDPSNVKCSGVVEGVSIAAITTDASKQKKIKKRRKELLSDQVIKTTLSSSDISKERINFFSNTEDSPGNVNLSELSGIPEDGQCDNNIRAPCPAMGTNIKEPDTCHLTLKVVNPNQCLLVKVKGNSSSINGAQKIEGKDKETDQPDIDDEQKGSPQNYDQVLLQSEKIGSLDEHEAHGNTMESGPADGEHSDNGTHLTPIAVPNLDQNLLNDPETKKINNILPIAKANLDVGTKEDRKLLVNHKIGMNQPEAGVSIIEPTLPSRLIQTPGAPDDTHDNHKKKKKKKKKKKNKTKKSAVKIQDNSYGENEAQKTIGDDGLHHDSEVKLPSSSKASECTDSESKSNEARFTTKLLDVDMVEELKASRIHRRKHNVKKSPNTAMDNSDMEPANNGMSGSSAVLPCSQTDHFPKETGKGDSLLFRKVKDVQTKLLDDSASYSKRKVGDATINESNSMKLTQTMEDVGICEQRMEKKGHNSTGDYITVPSVTEKENQGDNLESNRAQNSIKIVSILPIAKADIVVGTKEGRKLLVNHEIGMNQPEAGVSITEPTIPSRLIHTSGAHDDTHHNHDMKKKKKTKKRAGKINDTSYGDNEAQKAIGDDGLCHDSEMMLPSSSKASECIYSELKSNEARFTTKFLDGDMVEEFKESRGNRRKQNVTKSHNTAMDNSDIEPANNGKSASSAVLLRSPTDHFPEETGKGENLFFHKVKDAQTKLLDDSAAYAGRKVGDATINESDSMKLTQTMVDVGICDQIMKKKGHNSAGDCLTVLSASEKENQGNNVESNLSQNSIEVEAKKKKKSIEIVAKKKRKGQLIASDCLENIPLKDQEVGVVYATVENANNFLDFEQDGQHVDSQVLSNKSDEQLGEIHFTAASSDNLVRHGQDKDKGVNFKHYFLPGQKQDKVVYVDKIKEAAKPSEGIKCVKKVKKRGLPSVSTSAGSHNSVKLSENKDSKDKSRVRCSTGKKDEDFIVSSKVSDIGVLDSNPTEMRGMPTRKKHKENTVASLFMKDKNMPLDKTYLERSGISSGNGGNKRRQSGLNVSDKAVMNTPRKNSLFEKVGSLFQDCSGESSIDENPTSNSDASTCSPSDSSSQSGCSEGENDLGQAYARKGPNDAQGPREKNNAKLDLSASSEMTFDMILRSSKRFKKAKLTTLSQNELEQTDSQLEFVTDTQPIKE